MVITKCVPNNAVLLAHPNILKDNQQMAHYYFTSRDLRKFKLAKGLYQDVIDSVFNSVVPAKIIIALVASENIQGNYNTNNFNFETFDVNYFNLLINCRNVSHGAFKAEYGTHDYMNCYAILFRDYHIYGEDVGNDISYYAYANGFCFYV